MKKIGAILKLSFILPIIFISCSKKPVEEEKQTGNIEFIFEHKVDGSTIQFDTLMYFNEADNQYMVNEIQYFISDITLHRSDNEDELLDAWEDIVYVDTDLNETLNHFFPDEIQAGNYDSISFTFGINETKNHSLMFVNPPESFMFWPELLGGGYHYLKLNGKWLDTLDQLSPFNFHLGIGQVYETFPDEILNYVHNEFKVTLSNSSFEILPGETKGFRLIMNVENWFQLPNIYNHNDWGGDIMQKQNAMKLACENGRNVFTIENE